MKNTYLIAIAIVFLSLCPLRAQELNTNWSSKDTMDLPAAAPQQALGLYEHISGLALIQDSHVVSVHKLIHLHGSMSSRSEVMKFIEKDLMEQAGIVITRLDDKRASATYNDALPITQKEH